MTVRIERLVTSGTFQLAGGSREVENNVSPIGDGQEVIVIDAPLACAWLPAEHAAPGTMVEIEHFGAKAPAGTAAQPLFDPEMSRIRQ